MKKLKKNHIILIAIAVIILATSIGFYLLKKNMQTPKSSKISTYTISSGEKVFVNGIIGPEGTEDIYLDATKGKVDKVSVKDGQVIKKGDNLLTYKNEQVTEQINQINSQLKASKSQREELLAQKKAQEEAIKNQALLASQNPTEDKATNTSNINSSLVSTASIDSQISAYEEQLASLKNKEYAGINAPIDGRVILHGESNNMTSPYITIESVNFYIKGTVNEKDQPKLKENQLAEIIILPTNKKITGKVTTVGNRPVTNNIAIANATAATAGANISNYEVIITLDSQENLTNGFHVQATIKLDDKGVEIPKTSILKEGEESYVFKVLDKKLVKQVITYSEDGEKARVTSGLSEGDEIAENPNDEMKEGISVE
ncbi:efflux RND transporter periplasmic adaptor subunit [Clostridium intestinale]|uniref:efflux RND transporter periplasmic adaptor subunit n=1 Tax=Clostridium intestinale TaxID=36845 RepID=UPI002DD67FA6|nr:biotin/lipoyl-binding protein [Clostridium intestinale]WRY50740.1 biotin/lipoyl-binding protein [Clostridium intestinale]